MLYPVIWEAFREWWLWREQFRIEETGVTFPPFVDFDILTNHYYNQNPAIWSPWHIRFAYESGAKCLYPNLPDPLSLVSNHREKGANYQTSMGSRTVTLQRHHINESGYISTQVTSNGDALSDAFLWSFPAYSSMVHQQYDFSVRRAGRKPFSANGIFASPDMTALLSNPREESRVRDIDGVGINDVKSTCCACHEDASLSSLSSSLSDRHWQLIGDMLEVYLSSEDAILHIEPVFSADYFTQLGLDSISLKHRGRGSVRNILVSENCEQWEATMQQSREPNISACLSVSPPTAMPGDANWESILLHKFHKYSFKLVIVSEITALRCLQHKLLRLWQLLSKHMFPYLIMLGTCVGAPTSLLLSGHSSFPPPSFSVMEDICSEAMWMDSGAVLYRRDAVDQVTTSSTAENNSHPPTAMPESHRGYYATVKRHEGGIISRRFQKTFTLVND